MSGSGYDTPIESETDDVLQRQGFAREIADLAVSVPRRWAVRIGVYGAWGTGKSSVLNLCRSIVKARGHVGATFSPWGYADTTKMLQGLAESAIQALEELGISVKGTSRRKARSAASEIGRISETALSAAGSVPGLESNVALASHGAKLVGPWLKQLLGDSADDFAAIENALGTKRLVVFVDDVDRAAPNVLPELLFALHEVMAQPGISYVVALDPIVVSEALSAYHPGFGKGNSFLEKVIQFPRHLPEPTKSDLAALAAREAREFASFIPSEALEANLALLPQNPRALRTALRNLWSFGREAERHDADELDWNLLIKVQLLRSEFPVLFHNLVADTDVVVRLLSAAHREERTQGEKEARREEIRRMVAEWVSSTETERPLQLLLALVEGGMFWNPDRIRYHALMVERPHEVTWKEYRAFFSGFLATPKPTTIDAWLADHSGRRETSRQGVLAELFGATVRHYQSQMERAADSDSETNQLNNIKDALAAIEVLDMLFFQCELRCEIDSKNFGLLVRAFRSWAHFASNRYQPIRARERTLLQQLVESVQQPDSLLEELAPWEPSSAHDARQQQLTDGLVEALVVRVAKNLEGIFTRPSGIRMVIASPAAANRWVLFNPKRFWSNARIESLGHLAEGLPSSVIEENCMLFLRKLADDRIDVGRWGYEKAAAEELLRNSDLVLSLWRGATISPVNVRYFSRLSELRATVEKKSGIQLPDPSWWERVGADLTSVRAREAENSSDAS